MRRRLLATTGTELTWHRGSPLPIIPSPSRDFGTSWISRIKGVRNNAGLNKPLSSQPPPPAWVGGVLGLKEGPIWRTKTSTRQWSSGCSANTCRRTSGAGPPSRGGGLPLPPAFLTYDRGGFGSPKGGV